MQPVSFDARRYDAHTIAFHWATVVLIAAQWLLAQGRWTSYRLSSGGRAIESSFAP